MSYRPEIDGLRAVAVLAVILFHAGFDLFRGGFVGVDVFFVISGYLITLIVLAELDAGTFRLVDFYERRVRRIVPALVFVVSTTVAFAWAWMMPLPMERFFQSVIAVAMFGSNLFFWQTAGNYYDQGDTRPLLHTWSLGVEEQFYILYPLFLLLLWRSGGRVTRWGVVAAFIVSLGLAGWGVGHTPAAAFYWLPTRGWELLLGACAALFQRRRDAAPGGGRCGLLSLLGLAMIVAAIAFYDATTPFPGPYALLPTIGAALVLLFAAPSTLAHRLLSMRPLVGIGLVSYSAYLWHYPLFSLLRLRWWDPPPMLLTVGEIVATFALAAVTWRFIERPFRAKTAISRKTVAVTATAGLCGLLIAGWWGLVQPKGLRVDGRLVQRPELLATRDATGRPCGNTDFGVRPPCILAGGAEGRGKYVLIGDSLAYSLSRTFYNGAIDFETFVDLSKTGCPYLPGLNIYAQDPPGHFSATDCDSVYQKKRTEYLESLSPEATVVYYASLPFYYWASAFHNGVVPNPKRFTLLAADSPEESAAARKQRFRASLIEGLDALASRFGRVIIVLPPQSNGWDPYRRAKFLSFRSTLTEELLERDLVTPMNTVVRRRQPIVEAVAEAAARRENLVVADVLPMTCDLREGRCYGYRDGAFLFSDALHLSDTMNRALVRRLEQMMVRP